MKDINLNHVNFPKLKGGEIKNIFNGRSTSEGTLHDLSPSQKGSANTGENHIHAVRTHTLTSRKSANESKLNVNNMECVFY